MAFTGHSPKCDWGIKKTTSEIAPILAIIFNFSFQTENVPQIWKETIVTPICRNKGNKSERKNKRSINILNCVGKAMERCIHDQTFKYLKSHNLFSKFQAAYMPNSSTESQVLELYHHIQTAMDNGKEIRMFFF